MNCFNNNIPNLTASEKIRNRKTKQLYKAAKLANNAGDRCSNFNGKIGFYPKTGQLRNTRSYQTFLALNRGYALCVDGAADPTETSLYDICGQSLYRGLASCARHNTTPGARVKLVNGRDSIYNVFSGMNIDPSSLFGGYSDNTFVGFLYGFPVIKSWPINKDDPLSAFKKDGSNNVLKYPLGNSGGCGIVIDPLNILFGADFCSTDINNQTQGPNKYLTFSHVSSFIAANGQLFDGDGTLIPCDKSTIYPGMIVVAGVGAITGNISVVTASPSIRQLFVANFLTAWGIVERVCCGSGPNGESNWWEIFIKVKAGQIVPQEKLPLTLNIPDISNAAAAIATILGKSGSVGGKKIQMGGIWETGNLSKNILKSPELFGKNPGGGGLAFYNSLEVLQQAAVPPSTTLDSLPPIATMGWQRRRPTVPAPWDIGITDISKAFADHDSSLWIKQPYLIIEGVGSCANNLLFGNKTRQNYMISYDPRAKNVRFNVNDRILRRYQL